MPDMTPVDSVKVKPEGKLPYVLDHVYGVFPPTAVRVWLYAVPVVPVGRAVVLMVNGLETVIDNDFAFVALFASFT
jgi:hypothetical protein